MRNLVVVLILALVLTGFSQSANAGNDQGNGGDAYALQFVSVAQKVSQYLVQSQTLKLDLDALDRAITTVKVESTDSPLYLQGVPKDALNFPHDRRIVFNRSRWNQMDAAEKPALVLHEYLGILGIENASYEYSKSLLGSFKYDDSHIQCKVDNQAGSVSLGVDESWAGTDTILLGVDLKEQGSNGWDVLSKQVPTGTLSEMIRNGVIMMALTHEPHPGPPDTSTDLISLQRASGPDQFKGFLARMDLTFPLTCTVSNKTVYQPTTR